MSTYEYLNSFGFDKPGKVHEHIRYMNPQKFQDFLDNYADTVWKNITIKRAKPGEISILPDSWAEPVPTKTLLQLAVYVDCAQLHDPLLDLAFEWKGLSVHPQWVMKYPDEHERKLAFALSRVAPSIINLLAIKPLVKAGIVDLVPTALLGSEHDPTSLYTYNLYGPNGSYTDITGEKHPIENIHEGIRSVAETQLNVFSATTKLNGTIIINRDQDLQPTRSIAVQFPDDPRPMVFLYFDFVHPIDRDGERVVMSHYHPDNPVDPNTFKNWVDGCKKEYIVNRVRSLERDITIALWGRSRILTPLSTTTKLMNSSIDPSKPDPVTLICNIDLPYFDKISMEDMVKARENEAAFQHFRTALDKAITELQYLNPGEAQKRIDQIIRDIILAPVAKVEKKMKSLKRTVFLDTVVLMGSLGTTLLSGGNTLAASVSLYVVERIASQFKVHKLMQDEIEQYPGYFYWKAISHVKR